MVPSGGRVRHSRTYFAAGLAVILLACAYGAARGGQPSLHEEAQNPAKHAQSDRGAPQGFAPSQAPGATESHPLYIHSQCEHGCGYTEGNEGWWEKVKTDPNATFAGVIAFLTFGLIIAGFLQWRAMNGQIEKLEDTIKFAETDSKARAKDMAESIAEAKRSAAAMERVAEAFETNVQQIIQTVETNKKIADRQRLFGEMQMRPYISVVINTARQQDTANGVKFSVIPSIQNTGPTAARRVKYRARAAIVPRPIPEKLKCTLPPEAAGKNLISPRQGATIEIVVEDFVSDGDVDKVKFGKGFSLIAWGVVTYYGPFGKRYRTTFCQNMYWNKFTDPNTGASEERVFGLYLGRHNNAT